MPSSRLADTPVISPDELSLTKVLGIGPAGAKDLYRKHKCSFDTLLSRSKSNDSTLPKQLRELVLLSSQIRPIDRDTAEEVISTVQSLIQAAHGTTLRRIQAAGSFRRGSSTVGDIDLLCSVEQSSRLSRVKSAIVNSGWCARVLCSGEQKTSFLCRVRRGLLTRIDVLYVPPKSYGAALLYFTGGRDHNIALRERAKRLGMVLNERGLWIENGMVFLAGSSEEEIYRILGVPYVLPTRRTKILCSMKTRPVYSRDLYCLVAAHCGVRVLRRMLPAGATNLEVVANMFGASAVTAESVVASVLKSSYETCKGSVGNRP